MRASDRTPWALALLLSFAACGERSFDEPLTPRILVCNEEILAAVLALGASDSVYSPGCAEVMTEDVDLALVADPILQQRLESEGVPTRNCLCAVLPTRSDPRSSPWSRL